MSPTELLATTTEFFAQLRQILGVEEGVTWKGFNLKQTSGGWFLVVSAVRLGGERVVAFYGGPHPEDCMAQFTYAMSHKPGMNWKPDRYAK